MLENKSNTQLHLRFAKSEDIPILVRHHCLMFEEINKGIHAVVKN